MNAQIIAEKLGPKQTELGLHALYKEMKSIEDIKIFMQGHIFAVWDFMSLLKALQQQLTCVQTPWVPLGSPDVRHFINEIVIDEESDVDHNGAYKSHFEMYYDAMQALGASTNQMDQCLQKLQKGEDVLSVIDGLSIPAYVKNFTRFNFELIEERKPHKIAAAFTFGRENVIPDMFMGILSEIQTQSKEDLKGLRYYFQRHIELDGDEHGPLALKMIDQLCHSEKDWKEVQSVAYQSLMLRKQLWDGIFEEIKSVKSVLV